MIIKMIRVKHQENGKTNEMSKREFNKRLRKCGGRMGKWAVESEFTREIKSFKFMAWIHPKKGGDDYQVEVDQCADSIGEAEKRLREYLGKTSGVTDDYELINK